MPCAWIARDRIVMEANPTALNILQDFEPSRTQGEGEAPAELWLFWLRRSVALPIVALPIVALPTNDLIGQGR